MTLGLNIDKLAGPGRAAKPVQIELVREITEADLKSLALKPAGSVPPPLKRLTDRHHSLARLIAAGKSEQECSFITGYDNSRISILKNSPAFQELLELYRQEARREFTSVLEHMAGISRDAVLELRERLEDTPERFTNNELMKISIDFTDRTVDRLMDDTVMPTSIELVAPSMSSKVPKGDESEGDEA